MALGLNPKKKRSLPPKQVEDSSVEVIEKRAVIKDFLKEQVLVKMEHGDSFYTDVLIDLAKEGSLVAPEIGDLSLSPVLILLSKEDFSSYSLHSSPTLSPISQTSHSEDESDDLVFEVLRNA